MDTANAAGIDTIFELDFAGWEFIFDSLTESWR
jgi:hypothetical protein